MKKLDFKNSITSYLLPFGFLFFSILMYSQNDSLKKKNKTNSFKTIIDNNKAGDGIQIGGNIKVNPIFDLNKPDKKPLKDFNYYLNLGKKTPLKNLQSMSSNKLDSDILVKRFFNGKDTSNPKLKSDGSLGTIESSTKYVKIEFRDHGLVDGDRIRIFLNEKVVDNNIMLLGLSAFITLKLNKGYNRIDFKALNQGRYGPNTAAFFVYDDKGKLITAKAWNLETNETATLGVIRY